MNVKVFNKNNYKIINKNRILPQLYKLIIILKKTNSKMKTTYILMKIRKNYKIKLKIIIMNQIILDLMIKT